jgi:UDP-glucose:(glucosyl)LPS alpha-1,2-glucosyltransferase
MAHGGTEIMYNGLVKRLPQEILDKVNIVARPDDFNEEKLQVLWIHDMPGDVEFLADQKTRDMFAGIVFVSSWQQTVFNINMGVPYSESVVIKNAIEPIPEKEKPNDGTIRLIYHPTPHRGLGILVPVFTELCKKYDNIHLDVFSNFDIYDRSEMNKEYEQLYDMCRSHEKITYHGSQPNDVVRAALQDAHIFAYPSVWRETSCLAALEAMSAECITVAPMYGALSETLANFGLMYNWTENTQNHANIFASALSTAIENIGSENVKNLLKFQKSYVDNFYSWNVRIPEWVSYLETLKPKTRRSSVINWMER